MLLNASDAYAALEVWMSRRMLVAIPGLALCGALLMPGTNGAQEQTRFRVMDSNGDGVVSRSEWPGGDQSFRVHDRNGDGVLSSAEIAETREGQPALPEFTS